MNPELQFKLNLYQNNPNIYSDDELDLLKNQLETAGIDKSVVDNIQHAGPTRDGDLSLGRTIGNFLEGTVEGATTLSANITEPTNTVEKVARSIGSLGGFVGTTLNPFTAPVKALGLGLKATNATLKAAKVFQKSKATKKLIKAADRIEDAYGDKPWLFNKMPSVPKSFAKLGFKGLEWAGKTARGQELMKSYKWLQTGTVSNGMAHEAVNLGLMSLISSLTVNPLNWKDTAGMAVESMVHGGIMGGAFGGIGNFIKIRKGLQGRDLKNARKANSIVKALAGATVQSIAFNVGHGEGEIPTEDQVYEFLLGAYFGKNAATARQRAVGSNIGKIKDALEKKIPFEESVKGLNITPEVKKDLKTLYNEEASPGLTIHEEIAKRYGNDFKTEDYYDVKITGGKNKGKEGKIINATNPNRIEIELGKGNYTWVSAKNMEYREPESNWTQTEKTNKAGNVKLVTKEIEGVDSTTGQKTTLQLVFRNGEISKTKLKFEDGTTQEPGIGRFFGDPNKGFEGARKLKIDDNPDVVFERINDIFEPTKNEYKPGETVFETMAEESAGINDVLELHRPANSYIAKNTEKAIYELQKQAKLAGKDLTRLEIEYRLNDALYGENRVPKSDRNWMSITSGIEKALEIGPIDWAQGSNLNKLGRALRRQAKSSQNKQTIKMVHLNFSKQGPVLEPYGSINAKNEIVPNKKKTVPKWVGVRRETEIQNQVQGGGFKTEKGSIYTLEEGNRTTRTKAKRPEHKDFGLKETSLATVYLTKNQAMQLASKFGVLNASGKKSLSLSPDGVSVNGKLYGGVVKPKKGLLPLEIWQKDGQLSKYHLGNKITEIFKDVKQPSATKIKRGTFSYSEIGTREGIIPKKINKSTGEVTEYQSRIENLFNETNLYNNEWLNESNRKMSKSSEDARYTHVKKTKDLYNDKLFVLGGSGDKDTIVITDLQFPVKPVASNRNAPRNYISNAIKGYGNINKALRQARTNFTEMHRLAREKGTGDIKKDIDTNYAYENMVASKMMFIENLNGKSFKEMLDANRKAKKGQPKPYILDAINLNKRFPVINAGEPALDPLVYKSKKMGVENGNFKVLLANALPRHKNSKYEKIISKTLNKELDAHRDGIYILRQDIFDSLITDSGLPINVVSAKGTLMTKNGNNGLMLGKYAYARASNELNSEMTREKYHGELYDTSIKQLGERQLYDVTLENGKNVYRDSNGKRQGIGAILEEIPITDHRVNLGVYENPAKNLTNQPSALQRWEWAFTPYLKEAGVTHRDIKNYFREVTKDNFEGNAKVNELLKKENSLTDLELAELSKVKIDDFSVSEVLRIAGSHKDSPVYNLLWDKLHRRFESVMDIASKGDLIDVQTRDALNEYMQIRSMADKILKAAPRLTPLTLNSKWAHRYTDLVLRNYLLRRVNKPTEKNSSKHILLPYDRFMQTNKVTAGLKPGEFIMYRDSARAKIQVGSETMSIEKAFHEYTTKFDPSSKIDKIRTEMLRDALEQVFLRVPADNLSGQRVLFPKAILNEKGTGVILHPEDMHFLGGADLDIDSAFAYRNTPKKFKEAIKKSKYVMKNIDPTGKEAQLKFGTGVLAGIKTKDLQTNPAYMLDPFYSEQVGHNAKINNDNLGVAVSQGQVIGRAMDYIENNPKQEYLENKKVLEEIADIGDLTNPVVMMESTKPIQKYMEEVVKAINMYADSGKFGALKTKDLLTESMWNDAGIKIYIKDKISEKESGVPILVEGGSAKTLFDRSVFGASKDFKSSLKGVSYVDGGKKQFTISQTKQAAEDYLRKLEDNNINPEDMPGVLTVKAEHLTRFEDNLHFIGNIDQARLRDVMGKAEEMSRDDGILSSYRNIDRNKDTGELAGKPIQKRGSDHDWANTQREMVSNDIDFIVSVGKLHKNFEKIKKIVTPEEVDLLKNEVVKSAADLKMSWQIEKSENFNRKRMSPFGTLTLADQINTAIKSQAEKFRNDYAEHPTLSDAEKISLGKLKREVFFDMLSSNVITGVNQYKNALLTMNKKRYIDALNNLKKGQGQKIKKNLGEAYSKFLEDHITMNQHKMTEDSKGKGGGTNLDMLYSSSSIPFEYLNKHFALRQKVEEQLQTKTKDPMSVILSDKPSTIPELKVAQEQRTEIRNSIRGYKEGRAKQMWLDKINKEIVDTKEVAQLRIDLNAIFDRNPHILENIETVFPTLSVKPYASNLVDNVYGNSLKGATSNDVRSFVSAFKDRLTAKDWVNFKNGGEMEKKFYPAAALQFGETIINKLGPFDVTLVKTEGKVWENGKLVKKDLHVPMSGFERLSMDNKRADQISTGLIDQFNNQFLKSKFDWLESLETGERGISRAIVEAAIGRLESRNKTMDATFKLGKEQSDSILKKIGKKEYTATINGKTRKYKGETLVKKVEQDIQNTMIWTNKNLLHTGVKFEDFMVGDRMFGGVPSIRETINRRIIPKLRNANNYEQVTADGKKIAKDIDNNNIYKLLELKRRANQAIERDGKVILRSDLKRIDLDEYSKWISKQIKEIDSGGYGVGDRGDFYFPHMNHPKAIINEFIKTKATKKDGGIKEGMQEVLEQELVFADMDKPDGGAMRKYNNFILHQNDRGRHRLGTTDKAPQPKSPSQRSRKPNLPHYEKSINVISQYSSQLLKARYNGMMALANSETIRAFESRTNPDGTPVMGSKQAREHWGRFMKLISLKDIGGQHILPETWLKDKSFKINPLYTAFTEGQLHKRLKKMGKFLNNEDMFLPKDSSGVASPEALADRLNWLSNLEARVSTSTLLFNTRGYTYNMVGGTANTIISAGMRPFLDSYNLKKLKANIPDPKLKKGDLDTRTMDWFLNWAKEHGAIETFWTSELAGNVSYRALKNMKGFEGMFAELKQAAKAGKDFDQKNDRRTVMEVLKKYNVDTQASDLGGFFMKKAETHLRKHSFLAHYMKAREVFSARGATFKTNDPALIQLALDGTVGSQYLYNNTARPLFTASPAGKILTRFQLWVANSMRKRKDIVVMAKNAGFKEGTEEFKRFERMAITDMFMFGMASTLPYSMFDATLPPPYNYYQEMSQMLYGTPQEKERAFFGQLPYPLNITGLVTPPSARFLVQPLGNLMSGDWDRFWNYQMYTWMPYGMVLKTGLDVAKSPIKAVDKITGFPLYRLNYLSKEDEKKEAA